MLEFHAKGGELMHIAIPKEAETIIKIFNDNGYEAYVVGGCVRDSYLGRKPEDWDITTSAKPQIIKSLFKKTIDTGIKHGTVTIRMGGESYETTTYRIDGEYEDGRHPKAVEFTSNLAEDLKRRDFTINAMAYSPQTGIIDMFEGIHDLETATIRCVGNPEERFGEDALRTLRAVRFAGQLNFDIDENTFAALKKLAPNLKKISAERIRVEITKLIMSKGPDRMITAKDAMLTKEFLPEWDEVCDRGIGENIVNCLKYLNEHISEKGGRKHKILCFALLLICMDNAEEIMKRLKFDRFSIEMVDRLVKWHDVRLDVDKIQMRKWLNIAGLDIMEYLFELREAYFAGFYKDEFDKRIEADLSAKKMYNEIIDAGDALYIKDLKISGKDIIAGGVPAGKNVGMILDELLSEVLCRPELNDREWLLEETMKIMCKNGILVTNK